MATPVIKTVGSASRQYATPQLFEDAIPANIVTTDETWSGEMYNDSEFTTSTLFSGTTTDATRWIKLTTATGESFIDHADAATNAQAYDQSKGVGIGSATAYTRIVEVSTDYVTIEKIQIDSQARPGNNEALKLNNVGNLAQNLIIDQHDAYRAVSMSGSGRRLVNSLVITHATAAQGILFASGAEARNVTVVSPSDITNTSTGCDAVYTNNIVKNVACFGFGTGFDASGWDTTNSSHNATDDSFAPGGNSQAPLTYADQYENTTASAHDFRVKSGSGLGNNGTRDQTYTNDLDIIDQARSTTTPTIGHWEVIAAAGNTITADQTETGDTISASIVSPRNLTSTQTETGDTQAAALDVLAQILASQSEAGDTQAASIVGVQVASIAANQAEIGDAQTVDVSVVVAITASQAEVGDAQTASLDVILRISASQTEEGDTQAATVTTQVTATITANQVEIGDTQAATLVNLVQILANQNKAGDTQAAALDVFVQVAASQNEVGDAQVAAILSGAIVLELGRIFKASVPQRTFKAALPIRTYRAAA